MTTHPSLQGYVALSASVAIYVPSTQDGDKPAPASFVREKILDTAAFLADRFGGATATKGEGFYYLDSGTMVREEVTIVTARCSSSDLTAEIPSIVRYARDLAADMGQESVGVEVDGTFYLVRA